MRLDYREKKGSWEAPERKPAVKNKPRREAAGLLTLFKFLMLFLIFGAGVGTGWLLCKKLQKPAPVVAAQPVKKAEPATAQEKSAAVADAPLTFYKSLPAGGSGVIGSGMNLKKPAPAAVPPRHSPPAATKAEADTAAPSGQKDSPARFAVQVASYRDRQEADKAQARLVGKGVAAYLTESKTDDAVWYRLRVGKHLTRAEAEELAGKSGKGAVVLPE